MNIAVIGFGNAGCKIADALLDYEADSGRALCRFVLAVNTAEVDLAKLERVPVDKRLLIGQTDERAKGRGVGADPDLGAEVAEQDLTELERAFDDLPFHNVDAFLVVAGLGGGTGSGGAPVLTRSIRETYAEPVYGLGVLPDEDEGGRAALNAARSLRSLADAAQNLILLDNDAWQQAGDSVEGSYVRINREAAKRVATLLAAGELDGSIVSESAIDSSDVRRTLSTGGVSTIAHASAPLERGVERNGLLNQFRTDGQENATDPAMKVYSLVRKAVRSRLTCPAEIGSAERSLIVVSGPPRELSHKGLDRAREWLEAQTDSAEVLAGDDPRRDVDRLSTSVLLSNVTDVPRIDALQRQGVDAQARIESQAERRSNEIDDLITDDEDVLDPV